MKKIVIRKIKLQDSRFVLNLFNKAVENKLFKTKKKISYKQHQKWFLGICKSPKTKILVCMLNRRKIGYIKYDLFKKSCSKVSINLDEKFRGINLGGKMLRRSYKIYCRKFKINSIYAEVLMNNKHSKFFFLKNGYRLIKMNKKLNNEFNKKNLIFLKKINLN